MSDLIFSEKSEYEYIILSDVVFVSPLYRLGPFGFTSLGIEEAPGNQGFMDLVKALEWINSNIGKKTSRKLGFMDLVKLLQ